MTNGRSRGFGRLSRYCFSRFFWEGLDGVGEGIVRASNREWLDGVTVLWADVAPRSYAHAPHTLRGPGGCRKGVLKAFHMPMVIHDLRCEQNAGKPRIMVLDDPFLR